MADEKKKRPGTTSVADYRDKIAGVETEVTLPSGAVFVVKRLSVMDYLKEGLTDIPNEYFQFIGELAQGKVDPASEDAKKNYELFEKFLRITVEKGIVSPPIILKHDKEKVKDYLLFSELMSEDQKALISHISGKI